MNDWITEAKRILADENSTPEMRNQLYSELAGWRSRISALNELGHELMGHCDIDTASLLDRDLTEANTLWQDISTEVSGSVSTGEHLLLLLVWMDVLSLNVLISLTAQYSYTFWSSKMCVPQFCANDILLLQMCVHIFTFMINNGCILSAGLLLLYAYMIEPSDCFIVPDEARQL